MQHLYPVTIRETHIDSLGHVNNAVYLTLFEEARWEWITAGGYNPSRFKPKIAAGAKSGSSAPSHSLGSALLE